MNEIQLIAALKDLGFTETQITECMVNLHRTKWHKAEGYFMTRRLATFTLVNTAINPPF